MPSYARPGPGDAAAWSATSASGMWGADAVRVAGKSGISQARSRLGAEPLRRLYERVARPIATPATKGARYRAWRLVSLDGSCLDVADTEENRAAFGRPEASRGGSAFPQVRFVALVENGTHVLFGARLGAFADGETTLAHEAVPALGPGMLCLADRQFFGHALWQEAAASGADLLWRVKRNVRLPREAVLAEGSYLSTVYPSEKDRRHRTGGVRVRVVEYRLEGIADAEPLYRLVTTILDPATAPAAELAALYHERWEIEGALAELKTRLRGARMILRGKTPELVRQEFWGLLLAHFAVRGLMHEAALRAGEDPDRLSFLHAVRVVRRKLPLFAALPPSGQARPARGGAGRDPGGARGEPPRPAGAARGQAQDERLPAPTTRAATNGPDRLRCRHQDRKVNGIGPSPDYSRGGAP